MAGSDGSQLDPPVGIGILTVSDACARGEREDESGAAIESWAKDRGFTVVSRETVPDETARIVPALLAATDGEGADLLLTTGGTGLTERDLTPEATLAVIEREAPGVVSAILHAGLENTPFAALSRARAGVRGRTLIVNLPGSPRGARDGLEVLDPLVPHIVRLLRGEGAGPHPPERGGGDGG